MVSASLFGGRRERSERQGSSEVGQFSIYMGWVGWGDVIEAMSWFYSRKHAER